MNMKKIPCTFQESLSVKVRHFEKKSRRRIITI